MRIDRPSLYILAYAAALFVAGCGRTSSTLQIDGVVFKVLTPAFSPSSTTSTTTLGDTPKYTQSWNGGEVKYTIRDKKFLSINGRDYGTVKEKDEVTIDGATLAVTVNGVKREPTPDQPPGADPPKS